MKSLSEYAIYRLFEANDDEHIPDELLRKMLSILKDKDSLGDYVNELNSRIQAALKDDDAKALLKKAFGGAKEGYEFTWEMNNIAVEDLHPSQSEIDIKNSLGYPFEHGVSEATVNGKRYYEDDVVKMPFPLVTFNSTNILDGHHRWSQTYAFNRKAKMECIDIKVKGGEKLGATDMLKIVQGFMAAKVAETKKKNKKGKVALPVSKAAPERNIFKMDDKKIKEWVDSYVENEEHYKETAALIKCAGIDEKYHIKNADINKSSENWKKGLQAFSTLLQDNLKDLIKKNKSYAQAAEGAGNSREVMPQTDEGGDAKAKSALPNVKGSALNRMLNGKTDPDALKK